MGIATDICVASNAAGNVSRDFQLVVQGEYIQMRRL